MRWDPPQTLFALGVVLFEATTGDAGLLPLVDRRGTRDAAERGVAVARQRWGQRVLPAWSTRCSSVRPTVAQQRRATLAGVYAAGSRRHSPKGWRPNSEAARKRHENDACVDRLPGRRRREQAADRAGRFGR